jgi:hypothetical protein
MLNEMSPKAIAGTPYAFRLAERGLSFGEDGLCRLLETRSGYRREETCLSCLEDRSVRPCRMEIIRYMNDSCPERDVRHKCRQSQ